jgi:hypothetical protein
MGAKILALASTALPIGIAISVQFGSEQDSVRDPSQCTLTDYQVSVLAETGRMLQLTAFADIGCRAHYNMTLGDILARADDSCSQ